MSTREELDRVKREYKGYLIAYYGDDSDESAEKYLEAESRKRGKQTPFSRRRGTATVSLTLGDDARERFEQGIEKYNASFIERTPNDDQVIRSLVVVELQLEAIREQLFTGSLSGEDLRSIIDAQGNLSAEHRQLQRTLGIDRKTRDDSSTEQDAVTHVNDIISQASEFYKQKIVNISHCNIKFGHLLCHFPDWSLSFTCPKCGEAVIISGSEDRKEKQEKLGFTYTKKPRGRPRKVVQ